MVGKIQSTPPQKENTKPQELSLAQMQTPCNFLNPPFFFLNYFLRCSCWSTEWTCKVGRMCIFIFWKKNNFNLPPARLAAGEADPRGSDCVSPSSQSPCNEAVSVFWDITLLAEADLWPWKGANSYGGVRRSQFTISRSQKGIWRAAISQRVSQDRIPRMKYCNERYGHIPFYLNYSI